MPSERLIPWLVSELPSPDVVHWNRDLRRPGPKSPRTAALFFLLWITPVVWLKKDVGGWLFPSVMLFAEGDRAPGMAGMSCGEPEELGALRQRKQKVKMNRVKSIQRLLTDRGVKEGKSETRPYKARLKRRCWSLCCCKEFLSIWPLALRVWGLLASSAWFCCCVLRLCCILSSFLSAAWCSPACGRPKTGCLEL